MDTKKELNMMLSKAAKFVGLGYGPIVSSVSMLNYTCEEIRDSYPKY